MGHTDFLILNDPEFCFIEIVRKKVAKDYINGNKDQTLKSEEQQVSVKHETSDEHLKSDKSEIVTKVDNVLEKDETQITNQDEDNVNKETDVADILDNDDNSISKIKEEKLDDENIKNDENENDSVQSEDQKIEKNDEENTEKNDENIEKNVKDEIVNKTETDIEIEGDVETEEKMDDENNDDGGNKCSTNDDVKVSKVDDSSDSNTESKKAENSKKQADQIKAMLPDLDVIEPLTKLPQIDTFILKDFQNSMALDFSEATISQLFNSAVNWPKEYALQVRLQHIVHAVEHNEWPVSKTFTAYVAGIGPEYDMNIHEIPNRTPKRESSTPMSNEGSEIITITTDHGAPKSILNKNRPKKHIAIDVETERAKLQALVNSNYTNQMNASPSSALKTHYLADNDDSEESRRSTPSLQPPPAHQQSTSRVLSTLPIDMKYHSPKIIGSSTLIPGKFFIFHL